MRVSIHQPQYLPWLPYLLKIAESDHFIFLDSVDFQKNGLQNRNQVKTGNGPLWLTVPVQQSLGQKICNTPIQNSADWRKKHLQSIKQSYAKARDFSRFESDLDEIFMQEWDNLSALNIELTLQMMRWFDIATPWSKSSEMEATGKASDLVLNLCQEVGATHYISGTGGKDYMILKDFAAAGVEVEFRAPATVEPYPQMYPKIGFVGGLSAVDILFNCGPEWRNYLKS
ncbi:WbqC family protein [Sphingomonas sp. R-74633]|nr:WbqC family protein [Sphingomonas sp. R-74633]